MKIVQTLVCFYRWLSSRKPSSPVYLIPFSELVANIHSSVSSIDSVCSFDSEKFVSTFFEEVSNDGVSAGFSAAMLKLEAALDSGDLASSVCEFNSLKALVLESSAGGAGLPVGGVSHRLKTISVGVEEAGGAEHYSDVVKLPLLSLTTTPSLSVRSVRLKSMFEFAINSVGVVCVKLPLAGHETCEYQEVAEHLGPSEIDMEFTAKQSMDELIEMVQQVEKGIGCKSLS